MVTKEDRLWVEFEKWWDSLAHPWEEPAAKVAAWQAWQHANYKVRMKIMWIKGIDAYSRGYNSAMNRIWDIVKEK